jgi:hypothetical protein
MAEPMARVLADRPLARAMAEASRGIDLSPWSTGHMVDRLEDVYRSVLAAK